MGKSKTKRSNIRRKKREKQRRKAREEGKDLHIEEIKRKSPPSVDSTDYSRLQGRKFPIPVRGGIMETQIFGIKEDGSTVDIVDNVVENHGILGMAALMMARMLAARKYGKKLDDRNLLEF